MRTAINQQFDPQLSITIERAIGLSIKILELQLPNLFAQESGLDTFKKRLEKDLKLIKALALYSFGRKFKRLTKNYVTTSQIGHVLYIFSIEHIFESFAIISFLRQCSICF